MQVLHAAADILGGIEWIADARTCARWRHQLHQSLRPTRDNALGLNADSAWMIARTIDSSTPKSFDAAAISAE
jgi:hypothetical protein